MNPRLYRDLLLLPILSSGQAVKGNQPNGKRKKTFLRILIPLLKNLTFLSSAHNFFSFKGNHLFLKNWDPLPFFVMFALVKLLAMTMRHGLGCCNKKYKACLYYNRVTLSLFCFLPCIHTATLPYCNALLYIHRLMGGPAPPNSWKGNLNVSYNIGPGFVSNHSSR